jgi:hypothetical protein
MVVDGGYAEESYEASLMLSYLINQTLAEKGRHVRSALCRGSGLLITPTNIKH